MTIVTIRYYHFGSDWTYERRKEIIMENYKYFNLVCRGENSWHLVGHTDNNSEEFGHGLCSVVETYELIKSKLRDIQSSYVGAVDKLFERLYKEKYSVDLVALRLKNESR